MTDSKFDIDIHHPEYDALAFVRQQSRDLYDGFWDGDSRLARYLIQTENDTDEGYTFRLRRSVYDNIIKAVISSRQSLLWRRNPVVRLPEQIAIYKDNIDLHGTKLLSFFKDVTTNADVDGICWVLCDYPNIDLLRQSGVKIVSRQDEKDMNIRPYFVLVPASDVINWSDPNPVDGQLDWLVHRVEVVRNLLPGIKAQRVIQWAVWYRTHVEVWQKNENEEHTLISSTEHNLKLVPWVPFFGIKKTQNSGLPFSKDLIRHAINMLNSESEIDYALFMTNRPTPYVIGPKNPEEVEVGPEFGIYLPPESRLGFLEPYGRGIALTMDRVREMIRRMYLIALYLNKRDTGLVQSAEAMKQESTILKADLGSAATNHEGSVIRCFQIFAKWLGLKKSDITFSIQKDFDDTQISEAILKELREMVMGGLLTKKTFLDALKKGEVLDDDFDIDSELSQLANAPAPNLAPSL